jgi:hypothetical protein
MRKVTGIVGATWGLCGVLIILSYACVRLSGVAISAFEMPWSTLQWVVLVANTVFMVHSEGYRGFQRSFSPRVVARARHIMQAPSVTKVVLAPLFCMSYFGATRRRMFATYALSSGIVLMVLTFEYIPQPWRGILDVGVVAGLMWGIASLAAFVGRALTGRDHDVSPELPHPAT